MDFIEVLSIILPVFATVGVFCVIVVNLYKKIRRKFPINVNCWFCNEWSTVEYDMRNSWECPKCDQYNGFTSDGDYNTTIPAQHDEFLNKTITTKSKHSPTTDNGLCNICTNNQRLKIHQLAVFSPIDEANYDEEIEKYQEQLERAYPLCPQCEKTVKKTLRRQKSMLLGLKLSDLRKQGNYFLNLSFSDNFNTAKKVFITNILKISIVILAILQILITARKIDFIKNSQLPKIVLSYVVYLENSIDIIFKTISVFSEYFYYLYNFTVINNSIFIYLQKNIIDFSIYFDFIKVNLIKIFISEKSLAIAILGLILELTVIYITQKVTRRDGTRLFSWIFNIFSSYINISNGLQVLQLLQIFACIFLIIFISSKNTTKIEKLSFSNGTSYTSTPEKSYEKTEEHNIFKSAENLDCSLNYPSLSSFNSTFTDNFMSMKPSEVTPIFGQKPVFENPLNFKFSSYRPGFNESFSDRKSVFNESLTSKLNETLTSKLNESIISNESFNGEQNLELSLNDGLNKLHLSTYRKEINSNELPTAFRIANYCRPKPVLSPPKLGNLTQSSWLAGGYWKNGDYLSNCSNLSRSSSQSSGFGSQTSSQNFDVFNSLPPSRNNSICGEYDKYSVFSEPAYHYTAQNKYKNNSTLLENSFVPVNVRKNNLTASNDNINVNLLTSNKCFVPLSSRNSKKSTFSLHDNIKGSPNSIIPISTQNIKKPMLSSTNDNFWTSEINFRPNSTNSHNLISDPSKNNALASSVIYKPRNGFVKGSLLQKWREQNCVDNN